MKFNKTLMIFMGVFLFLISNLATADRGSRSARNKAKADAWCTDYTELHDGARCIVKRKIKLCPKGFRSEKVFKKKRVNDYKAYIKGKKEK